MIAGATALALGGASLEAQAPLSLPARDTEFHEPTIGTHEFTAAGYVEALKLAQDFDTVTFDEHEIRNGQFVLPGPSKVASIDQRVERWVEALDRSSLPARGLMNVAALRINVGDDAGAQRRIDQWLKTPKLTLKDTSGTLAVAVKLFAKAQMTPSRLHIIRNYEARLEALPRQVAIMDLCEARFNMAEAYSKMGQGDSVIAISLRAFALDAEMSYEQRFDLIGFAIDQQRLLKLMVGLSGRPRGAERIDSLLTAFRGYLPIPPAELARDTALTLLKTWFEPTVQHIYDQYHWLGRPAPAYVATHWLNMTPPTKTSDAAPGARIMPLDDGTIHLLGFGWFSCGFCHMAMRQIQRQLAQFPQGVYPIYHEYTEGYFGNDFVTPDEEVEDLKKFFLGRRHYTFPISIWAGPKDSTETGGALPRPSPTFKALAVSAGPTFYVTDGHGIVRYMQEGYRGIDPETELRHVIDLLIYERDHGTAPGSVPVPPTLPSLNRSSSTDDAQ